ncbi:hypothetical protein [Halobacterium jilantaiense]|uniref:Uncharacterized protein n=1 Tax=Halobacterium jilantaiense TaxID=355548 RepID=A0A1I0MKL9_9EURY|nr:hypothetical protein [Halobacterium jilantaiense]SEV88386.1 hypothetical protein SAMN04487945_0115 [Halobacterium jilantaiense]
MSALNVSLLIPLFLLVATALATAAREVELVDIAARTDKDLHLLDFELLNVEPEARQVIRWSIRPGRWFAERVGTEASLPENGPKFGRFSLIHGFNTFLVVASLLLVANGMASLDGALVAGLIAVFWLVLPIIEVNEYDQMMERFNSSDPLDSVAFHMIASSVLSTTVIAFALHDLSQYTMRTRVAGLVVYLVAGVFVVGNSYQLLLRQEVDRLIEYRSREQSTGAEA